MKNILLALCLLSSVAFAKTEPSIARIWNEELLNCVRGDYARPTVTARNLYHFSILTFESWAVYSETQKNFYLDYKVKSETPDKDRHEALSYAVYGFLLKRFKNAP